MRVKIVGTRVKERRLEINMSQELLANALNMTKQNISRIEQHSEVQVNFDTLERLSKALGCVSNDYLLGNVEKFNQRLDNNGKTLTLGFLPINYMQKLENEILALLPHELIIVSKFAEFINGCKSSEYPSIERVLDALNKSSDLKIREEFSFEELLCYEIRTECLQYLTSKRELWSSYPAYNKHVLDKSSNATEYADKMMEIIGDDLINACQKYLQQAVKKLFEQNYTKSK